MHDHADSLASNLTINMSSVYFTKTHNQNTYATKILTFTFSISNLFTLSNQMWLSSYFKSRPFNLHLYWTCRDESTLQYNENDEPLVTLWLLVGFITNLMSSKIVKRRNVVLLMSMFRDQNPTSFF